MPKLMVAAPRRPWLPAAWLALVVLLVFSPLIFGGGFFWDDHLLLLDNRAVWAPGLTGLRDIWFATDHPDYFPLTITSYWIEARIWDRNAAGYHLTNILLHAASAILLWRIFLRLRFRGALLAALLFAISPVNVESVAWIAERKNTLSMTLACGSVLCWLRSEDERRSDLYWASVALFAGSLLAKTATVVLPVVIVLLAWLRATRTRDHKPLWPELKRQALRLAPFFALSLALGLVTVWFQYHRAIGEEVVRSDSLASRTATAGCAIWFYLGKALLPVWITFCYPRWNVLHHGAVAFLPGALVIAILVSLWFLRRFTLARTLLVAAACYVLLLLPMLGFLNIFFMRYSLVSDHWQYHASAVIYALLGGGASWAIERARGLARHIALGAVVAGALAMAAYSVSLATVYRSATSIWTDTLRKNPTAWIADAQLGLEELQQAGTDRDLLSEATAHLSKALELAPQLAGNYLNMGAAYQHDGRLDDALHLYQHALTAPQITTTDRGEAYMDQAAVLVMQGRMSDAEAALRQALEVNPRSAMAAFRLGGVEAREGRLPDARRWYEQAVTWDETMNEARYALARTEAQMGDLQAAATQVSLLTGASPEDPEVRAAVAQMARSAAGGSTTASRPAP